MGRRSQRSHLTITLHSSHTIFDAPITLADAQATGAFPDLLAATQHEGPLHVAPSAEPVGEERLVCITTPKGAEAGQQVRRNTAS